MAAITAAHGRFEQTHAYADFERWLSATAAADAVGAGTAAEWYENTLALLKAVPQGRGGGAVHRRIVEPSAAAVRPAPRNKVRQIRAGASGSRPMWRPALRCASSAFAIRKKEMATQEAARTAELNTPLTTAVLDELRKSDCSALNIQWNLSAAGREIRLSAIKDALLALHNAGHVIEAGRPGRRLYSIGTIQRMALTDEWRRHAALEKLGDERRS